MVIQANMSPKAIVEVWKNTASIFERFNVPITEKAMETGLEPIHLQDLLFELNEAVGSSSNTCVEGG